MTKLRIVYEHIFAVSIQGNATEHSTAMIMVMKNKIDIESGIGL